MPDYVMDDYADIAKRMRELKSEDPDKKEDPCPVCDGSGWILSPYQAVGAPNFEECPCCFNPEGYPSP